MQLSVYRKAGRSLVGAGLAITTLILSFTLAWCLLAQQSFLYPVWHDVGGIGEGIDRFGPKNKYKSGFGQTTKAQRSALFEQINVAVHAHGEGLRDIRYQTPTSGGSQPLLRDPEVVHLQDVANLIDKLKWLALGNALLWLVFTIYIFRNAKAILRWSTSLYSVGGLILAALVTVSLIGPVKVFNQLHIWIFPKDHQWFFYYQESLMSTLMMAPN